VCLPLAWFSSALNEHASIMGPKWTNHPYESRTSTIPHLVR
jgi:hypothetical protein